MPNWSHFAVSEIVARPSVLAGGVRAHTNVRIVRPTATFGNFRSFAHTPQISKKLLQKSETPQISTQLIERSAAICGRQRDALAICRVGRQMGALTLGGWCVNFGRWIFIGKTKAQVP